MLCNSRSDVSHALLFLAALTALLLTAPLASAQTLFDGETPSDAWLRVDKFVGNGGVEGTATARFTMSGSFNLPPAAVAPQSDVTFHVDAWSLTFPAASWVQSGRSSKYSAKVGDCSASIIWWFGGSSKCTYILSAKKQDMDAATPNFPTPPIRLVIGAAFDESVDIELTETGNAVKLARIISVPDLLVDQVAFKLNTRIPNKDSATFKGRLVLGDAEFDPATTGAIGVLLGPVYFEVPPGTILIDEVGTGTYTGDIPGGGTWKFNISVPSLKFTATATNVDLSSLATPAPIGIALVDDPYEAIMLGEITLKHNRPNTLFTY